MKNRSIRRGYVVGTSLVIGALLIGCSQQPGKPTEITFYTTEATEVSFTAEQPSETTGDTIPTESVQATEIPTTESQMTEPPMTEPPTTEPPATEPPATEPPATEPPATEPPATEPPTTEPPATSPPATVPEEPAQPQEPDTTEPTEPTGSAPQITLDYDGAMAYGNQYAADTYGYEIDRTLHADNAGFEFPYSASVAGIIEKGGQEYLHLRIARKVDSLAETLSARGIQKAYINCHIYEDADGVVQFYVYYG